MKEQIFYIGNCPVCYEYGRLEIDKDLTTGKYLVYCEECLAEWDSPQDALKNVNGRRNFEGGPVRSASLDEIVSLGWDKYVVEASDPKDMD